MKTHTVNGAPAMAFGQIMIPGYTLANFRKVAYVRALARCDNAGTNSDWNMIHGVMMKPVLTTSHALYTGAVTGFELVSTGNQFGIGSRVTVRGAGK